MHQSQTKEHLEGGIIHYIQEAFGGRTRKTIELTVLYRGQVISKGNFVVFISPNKQTKKTKEFFP